MISLFLIVILLIAVAMALSGCATTEPIGSSKLVVETTPARAKITMRVPTKLPSEAVTAPIGGDLALGDSIAVGAGGALGVRTIAVEGEPSCPNPRAGRAGIVSMVPSASYGRVVVSAGVNDIPGACVGAIRSKLRASVVVWLVGLSQRHGEAGTVAAVAAAHGDRVVRFQVGPDGVHPRSYPEVAAQVRRAW